MSIRQTGYNGIHNSASKGIGVYEDAVDFISKNLWPILAFNAVWFIFFISGWVFVKIAVMTAYQSILAWILSTIIYIIIFIPFWEIANILKFRRGKGYSLDLLFRVFVERLLYYSILLCGYGLFVLPGIYLHTRLMLHTAILTRETSTDMMYGLKNSWRLTSGNVVKMYSLWIVTTVSKPVAALPIGFAFIFERPLSGFAKDMMVDDLLCSTYEETHR